MRVMLVEDDDRVAAALQSVLQRHHFDVRRANGLAQAMNVLDDQIDILLLDLMLPDGDGLDLCKQVRAIGDVGILVTSGRSELDWRLHALNLGADDYLVKPYDVRELIARMVAITRRRRTAPTTAGRDVADPEAGLVRAKQVCIDMHRRQVQVAGTPIALTRKEFAVLEELAAAPGAVVRREQLLAKVWHSMFDQDRHTLDVHVAALRAKTGVPTLIETVRGVGYRLAVD